jgi:ATP-binding cassette subfamily A (ABC1) protein 3
MDPVNKRFMWEVIARICVAQRECSIILTTHSMEECEALCTRAGIMVGGRLRCLGSLTHLKAKFGDGYQIDLKLSPPPDAAVKECSRALRDLPDASTVRPAELGQVRCSAIAGRSDSQSASLPKLKSRSRAAVCARFVRYWALRSALPGFRRTTRLETRYGTF